MAWWGIWLGKRESHMEQGSEKMNLSHPKSGFVTGQRQTYTYASEALTDRKSVV